MTNSIWKLIFERQAEKKFKKLDTTIQKRIISVFRETKYREIRTRCGSKFEIVLNERDIQQRQSFD